jgi:hypothetical protein
LLCHATQKNERFVVGRRGEPSVAIMSVKDYMETFAPAPEELRAMQGRGQTLRDQQADTGSDQPHGRHGSERAERLGK